MSYRNPKAAPINTGAAVYEGIQKLSGDVVTFANNERDRKAALITDSLAAQQAIDDDVNKMGLSLNEGDNNFETQVFAEAQAAKKAIAAQYETMSKTFSSPEQRAKAKSEIARLNKYPENLVADLSTGKYITDMYDKAMQLQQGKTGSISKSNDINLIGVAGDMKAGGKNTKIETNAAGSRTLVTTMGKDTYRLNISNITNGLKSNPNQTLFKTVQDDAPDIKTYQAALGLNDKTSIDAMIGSGKMIKSSRFDRSGKLMDLYVLDEAEANRAVSKLSSSLLDVPGNYSYANSIWQDRLGNGTTMKEAVEKEGRDVVLGKIQQHYKDRAIADAKNQFGVAIAYKDPNADKNKGSGDGGGNEGEPSEFENDKLLDSLVLGQSGGGLDTVAVGGVKYKVSYNTSLRAGRRATARERQLSMLVTPYVVDLANGDENGTPPKEFIEDKMASFKLWMVDPRQTKDKQLPLVKNYPAWRSSTGNVVRRKLPKQNKQ
jgi:hypothetical protein